MGRVYKDDVGTIYRIEIGDTTDGATVFYFLIKKPDGTETRWPSAGNCTIYAANPGILQYRTIQGDQNLAGTYLLQVYMEYPGQPWRGRGETFVFVIYDKWKPT